LANQHLFAALNPISSTKPLTTYYSPLTNQQMSQTLNIAVLDLYEGEVNEGMRCIKELIEQFKLEVPFPVHYQVFDVRLKNEIADLSFDAYISSGGPGSPITSAGSEWEQNYFGLMDSILKHNRENPFQKKFVFLICHSMQIFCRYYGYAKVTKRKSTSFGVMPMHKTKAGKQENFFQALSDPFYAVDSRDYQVVEPNEGKIWSGGGNILCLEKHRPLVMLERAVMAIRFNDEIIGTQFHPEVDSDGMHRFFLREDKRKLVVEKYGEKKYFEMMQMLNEPDKIKLTYRSVIPSFLRLVAQSRMNSVFA
jgi:homoserine O-succinyltransferase/O-acetyltransferase